MSRYKKVRPKASQPVLGSDGPNRKAVWMIAIVVSVVFVFAVVIGIGSGSGFSRGVGSRGTSGASGAAGTAISDPWPGVETYPSEGQAHVEVGTRVNYKTDPPTSGPHYEAPVAPRFYEQAPPAEALVHNLEHGHVIVYYDKERISEDDLKEIRKWTSRYNGYWDAVVAVPRQDEEHPIILTAWTRALRLDGYDEQAFEAFIDAYRGRGPENPVR